MHPITHNGPPAPLYPTRPPAGGSLHGIHGAPVYSTAGAHRPLTPFPLKGPASRPGTPLGRPGSAGGGSKPPPAGATADAGQQPSALPPAAAGVAHGLATGGGISAAAALALAPAAPPQRPARGLAAAAAAPAPRLPRGASVKGTGKGGALLRPMRNTPLRLPGQRQQQQPARQLPVPAAPVAAGSKRAAETPLALTLALEGSIHHFSSGVCVGGCSCDLMDCAAVIWCWQATWRMHNNVCALVKQLLGSWSLPPAPSAARAVVLQSVKTVNPFVGRMILQRQLHACA